MRTSLRARRTHLPAKLASTWISSASFWHPHCTAPSAWTEHAPFAFWLTSVLEPKSFVELGTHRGYSYFAVCQAVRQLKLGTFCHAVDTWRGDEHAGFYGEEVYESVQAHNQLHYSAFSSLIRSTFDTALSYFSEGSIDLLHIDGRHFFEDVKHDFDNWRPKLSSRAVVLFHDTNVRERDFGVFRFWEELTHEFPSFEFLHGHGLGVLGYGAQLEPELRSLFEAAQEPDTAAEVREAYARLGAATASASRLKEREEELKVLTADLNVQKAKSHDLEETQSKLRAREEELRVLKANSHDLEAQRSSTAAKVRAREAKISELKAELKRRTNELSKLDRDIRALRNSNIWRITAPLRALVLRLGHRPTTKRRQTLQDRSAKPADPSKDAPSPAVLPRNSPRPGPRVLVFSHNLHGHEGAPKSLFELCKGLSVVHAYSPIVISPSTGSLQQEYEALGIPVIVMPELRSPFDRGPGGTIDPSKLDLLTELIGEYDAKALIANTTHAFHAVFAAKKTGTPVIWIIRESYDPSEELVSIAANCHDMFWEALQSWDHLVFVSRHTRDLWLSAIKRSGKPISGKSVSVIPTGLDISRLSSRVALTRTEARHHLKVEPEEIVLLNVGTITPRKNQQLLLDALLELPPHVLEKLRLFCVGANSGAGYGKVFLDCICSHEQLKHRVTHIPPPSDIGTYYLAADIFVLPSHGESYPRAILEAMHFGLPIIATPVFGVREQTEEGVSALYFDPTSAVSLANCIKEVLDPKKRSALSRGAKERFCRLSDHEFTIEAYHRLLESYCSQQGFSKAVHAKGQQALPPPEISVSVVVPNYNYSRYLPERLRSILAQTFPPREVIFLDDASTDDSMPIAEAILGGSAIPFRIVPNEHNEGTYRQWLKGVALAQCDYVWIAEADDTCDANFLRSLIQAIGADPRIAIAYSQSRKIDEHGTVTSPDNLLHTNEIDPRKWLHDYREVGVREVVDGLVYRNTIPNVSACLLKKSAIQGIEAALPAYRNCGDWLLYAHMLRHGDITYVATPLNAFRRHHHSATKSRQRSFAFAREILSVNDYIVNAFPIHASQIPKIKAFWDKDYRFDGDEGLSISPLIRSQLECGRKLARLRQRLAFITTNKGSHDGGSEVLWRDAARKMRDLGHDVIVLTKKWEPKPAAFTELEASGIKMFFTEEDGFELDPRVRA